MDKYTEPHISHSALVTIDTQNDFSLEQAPAHISGTLEVIPAMTQLLAWYRQQGLTIIHVVRLYGSNIISAEPCRRQAIIDGNGFVEPGTPGAELVQALKPKATVTLDTEQLLAGHFQSIGENEFIMYKPRWGAFYGTQLESFLTKRDIDTLVFCGCNYPNCPRTSIYEASERDFRVLLVRDAISQFYPRAETEMSAIGVGLVNTEELISLDMTSLGQG